MTILLVALIGMLLVPALNPPAAEARSNNKSKPVLLVHGIKASSSGGSCNSFNTYRNFLDDHGWARSNLRTVGYYDDGMDGCYYDLRHHGDGNGQCAQRRHDDDLGIQHIACEFAWTVWDHHSRPGINQTVDVVGHSMGGVIVRWALGQVQAGDSNYPPYLKIEDVVTMGAPHSGTGWADACDWYSHQCAQLKPDSGLMDKLTTWRRFRNPQPWPNHNVDWTVMGSTADSFASESSAIAVPGARHKVVWKSTCHYHGRAYSCHNIGHSDFKDLTQTHKHLRVRWKKGGNSWVHEAEDFWPARWSVQSLVWGPNANRG